MNILIEYDESEPKKFDKHFTRESVGFRTRNTAVFKNLIGFLSNIVNNANFCFTDEGISILSMDSSQISLIDMLIPTNFFSNSTDRKEIFRIKDSELNEDDDYINFLK